jgi:uncharacterized RDD family membrane protein YckC
MGTPLFAAPEQVKAGKIDPRTDVYAVGATLFYLIAGRGPFTGDPAAVIAQISSDPAPPLHGLCPAVPKDLDQVIARTLEKNPDDRFETLNELRKALLPFSSQGLAPATVGLRLGAYFIDTMLIGLVGGILGAAMFIWSSFVRVGSGFDYASDGLVAEQSPIRKSSLLITQLGCFTFSVLYFGLLEGRTGRSLGKRILGLRVVGSDGGRPGVFRAAMRAVLVPGLMWLSMSLILPLAFPRGLEIQTTSRATLLAQATQQLALVPILICLATMRSSNGYRGLHDMFTRTRVVTLRGSSQRGVATELPTVVPVVTAGEVEEYGPYRVVGSLGWGRDSRVYQARDETLNRRVWIYKKEGNGDAIDETRVRVGRPTRPRWLLGGVSDGRRWEAFESVAGSPISALTHDRGTISWEQGRIILRDLAGEIGTALDEGTLPAGFSIDHVWVDREGRVKLLEQPLETGPSSTEHSSQSPDAATAMAVLRTLVGSCTRAQLLPAHAYDFVVELSNRPDSRETLDWATGLLRELCERPGVLRWSDRLVALGVTMGAEYSFYNAAASVLVYCVFRLFEFSLVESLLVAASIAIVLPAVMAWLLRGGPVFHFIGISVRLRDGRPAGRLRCAWRSMLAWFPLMLTFAINIAVLPSVASMQVRGRTNPNETAQEILSREELLLIASAMPSLILLIFSLGLVYAVLHPNRGIQDLLSGTRIVPQ